MEPRPDFNFKDVLRAPAKALQAKQILCMSVSLVLALAVYDIFTYAAFLIDGQNFDTIVRAYGFFPFVDIAFGDSWVWAIYTLGAVLAILVVMLGFFAVSAINIEAVRGNRFLSARDALRYAVRRFPQMLLAEITIVLAIAFIVLVFALLGLVSRVPFIGDWIYTLLFVIPNFIIALFSIFIIFVLSLTVIVLPAVSSADRQGETFTAILETFSTIVRQPFRWAGYTLYSLVAAKVCSFVFAYFAYRAVEFMLWSTRLGGGTGVDALVRAGLDHLPLNADIVREAFNLWPGVDFGVSIERWARAGGDDPVTYVMAVMLFGIFVSILGYALAIVAAAQARGYVVLRYLKDDYSIADEDPVFFKDEHVNRKVELDELEEDVE